MAAKAKSGEPYSVDRALSVVIQTCRLLLDKKKEHGNMQISPCNLIVLDEFQIDILNIYREKDIKFIEYYRAPEVQGEEETEQS